MVTVDDEQVATQLLQWMDTTFNMGAVIESTDYKSLVRELARSCSGDMRKAWRIMMSRVKASEHCELVRRNIHLQKMRKARKHILLGDQIEARESRIRERDVLRQKVAKLERNMEDMREEVLLLEREILTDRNDLRKRQRRGKEEEMRRTILRKYGAVVDTQQRGFHAIKEKVSTVVKELHVSSGSTNESSLSQDATDDVLWGKSLDDPAYTHRHVSGVCDQLRGVLQKSLRAHAQQTLSTLISTEPSHANGSLLNAEHASELARSLAGVLDTSSQRIGAELAGFVSGSCDPEAHPTLPHSSTQQRTSEPPNLQGSGSLESERQSQGSGKLLADSLGSELRSLLVSLSQPLSTPLTGAGSPKSPLFTGSDSYASATGAKRSHNGPAAGVAGIGPQVLLNELAAVLRANAKAMDETMRAYDAGTEAADAQELALPNAAMIDSPLRLDIPTSLAQPPQSPRAQASGSPVRSRDGPNQGLEAQSSPLSPLHGHNHAHIASQREADDSSAAEISREAAQTLRKIDAHLENVRNHHNAAVSETMDLRELARTTVLEREALVREFRERQEQRVRESKTRDKAARLATAIRHVQELESTVAGLERGVSAANNSIQALSEETNLWRQRDVELHTKYRVLCGLWIEGLAKVQLVKRLYETNDTSLSHMFTVQQRTNHFYAEKVLTTAPDILSLCQGLRHRCSRELEAFAKFPIRRCLAVDLSPLAPLTTPSDSSQTDGCLKVHDPEAPASTRAVDDLLCYAAPSLGTKAAVETIESIRSQTRKHSDAGGGVAPSGDAQPAVCGEGRCRHTDLCGVIQLHPARARESTLLSVLSLRNQLYLDMMRCRLIEALLQRISDLGRERHARTRTILTTLGVASGQERRSRPSHTQGAADDETRRILLKACETGESALVRVKVLSKRLKEWESQPAQYCLPSSQVDGLTLEQWAERLRMLWINYQHAQKQR
eukprot:Rmarinus@m.22481